MERGQEMRRQQRIEVAFMFDQEKHRLEEEIKRVEATDIIEEERRKREDWIWKYQLDHNGKPPDKIDKYHDSFKVKQEKTKDVSDYAARKAATAKKQVKKAKKGKSSKEKGEAEQKIQVGPTEVVMKFDEFYEHYEKVWQKREEGDGNAYWD